MNLISGLMALSHPSRKLNYPGAEWESGSSESHVDSPGWTGTQPV